MTIKDYTERCVNLFKNRIDSSTGKRYYPDMISLHNTGGMNISSAHWWFLDASSYTSAHFLVGLDGEVRQYVKISDGSYCNGTTSDSSKKHYFGNAINKIIQKRSFNANLYTTSIEFVGNVGDPLTERQLESAVELIDFIRIEVKRIYGKEIFIDRSHLIGHYEITPLTREYCGKNIQFDEILKRLNKDTETVEQIQKTEPLEEPKEIEQEKEISKNESFPKKEKIKPIKELLKPPVNPKWNLLMPNIKTKFQDFKINFIQNIKK